MSDKKLVILAAAAVVMVLLAVIIPHISAGPAEPETPGYLMPGLNTGRIGSIAITSKDGDTVNLNRIAGRFVVADKDNYPAKVSEINNLLSRCQEMRWSQFITDNPANHEDLGVTEENARTVVKFYTPEPNSTLLAGVVVGKAKGTDADAYARLLSSDKVSSNKVYLAEKMPWLPNRVMNYIEQNLTSIKQEDIKSVTVSTSGGEYTLKAEDDSKDIVLENTPPGKKLKTPEARNVFTALGNFRFEDVSKKTAGLLFDKKYVCRLKDAAFYTIEIAQKDDKTYAICQADFTERVEKPDPNESEEQLKEKEAKLRAWDNAKEFSQKHRGWIYTIADRKAKNLTMELADLLEAEPEPQEPNEVKVEEPNAVNAEQ